MNTSSLLAETTLVSTSLPSGDITIKSLGRGKYGRLLGIPYDCNGNDICAKLIEEGLASPYWGGTKKAKVRKDGTWGE